MVIGPHGITNKLPHSQKAASLGVSLVPGVMLTAPALGSPAHDRPAWISVLLRFAAVGSLCPFWAALAGGMWCACLYVFTMAAQAAPLGAMVLAMHPTPAAIGPSAVRPGSSRC